MDPGGLELVDRKTVFRTTRLGTSIDLPSIEVSKHNGGFIWISNCHFLVFNLIVICLSWSFNPRPLSQKLIGHSGAMYPYDLSEL